MIGGMVGIVGHLTITDDVIINATSTVNRNITKPGIYTGFFPLMTHSDWKKAGMWLTKLDKITKFLNSYMKSVNRTEFLRQNSLCKNMLKELTA